MTVFNQFRSASATCCFALCLTCLFSGCALLGKREKVQIEEAPPYYHQDDYRSTDARSGRPGFHDPQKDPYVNDPRFIQNKQMLALEREIEESRKDQEWEEDYQATLERREKMMFWKDWSWFQSGNGTTGMSPEAKKISANLER